MTSGFKYKFNRIKLRVWDDDSTRKNTIVALLFICPEKSKLNYDIFLFIVRFLLVVD